MTQATDSSVVEQRGGSKQRARRMLDFEGLVNCRDLGGLRLRQSGRTRSGVLFRSETPQLMSEGDVRRAHESLGIGRVVDLRGKEKLGDSSAGSGPLGSGGRRVTLDFLELAGDPDVSDLSPQGVFLRLLDGGARPLAAFLAYLVGSDGAVLVHCHAGKDRTGFIVALTLAVVGVQDDDIMADYAMSGAVFETLVANLAAHGLGTPPHAPKIAHHKPRPEDIQPMLTRLRTEWSSPEAWAIEHGIDRALIERARARLAPQLQAK